jgi:hypothetical protein
LQPVTPDHLLILIVIVRYSVLSLKALGAMDAPPYAEFEVAKSPCEDMRLTRTVPEDAISASVKRNPTALSGVLRLRNVLERFPVKLRGLKTDRTIVPTVAQLVSVPVTARTAAVPTQIVSADAGPDDVIKIADTAVA